VRVDAGLEWGDAAIGGLATLALIVLAASGAMMRQPALAAPFEPSAVVGASG
jgi:hypothetical protein